MGEDVAATRTVARRKRWFAVASTAAVRVIGAAMQGISLLVIARLLGPSEFGAFASVFAVGGFLGILLGFGLTSLLLRVSAYGARAPELAGSSLILGYGAGILSGGVAWVAGAYVLGFGNSAAVLAGAAFGTSETVGRVVESIAFGMQREGRAQASLIFRRAVLAVALAWTWAQSGDVPAAVIIAVALAGAVAPVWVRGLVRVRWSGLAVYRLSRRFWLPTVLGRVEGLDTALASLVLAPAGLGLYAAAGRVMSPLNILTGSFLSIYTPRLANASGRAAFDVVFKEARKALLMVGAGLAMLGPLVGWLLEHVLGSGYAGVAPICMVLVLAVALGAPSQAYTAAFYATNRTRVVLYTRVVAVPTGLGLVALLGWTMGPVGAAVGLLVSQLLQLVGMSLGYRRGWGGPLEDPAAPPSGDSMARSAD